MKKTSYLIFLLVLLMMFSGCTSLISNQTTETTTVPTLAETTTNAETTTDDHSDDLTDDFNIRFWAEGDLETFCEVMEMYREDLHPDSLIDQILTLCPNIPEKCKYEVISYTEYGTEADAFSKPQKWRFLLVWGDHAKDIRIDMEWRFYPEGESPDGYSSLLKDYVRVDEEKQIYCKERGVGEVDYYIFIGENSVVNASLKCDPQDLDSFRTHLFDHIYAMENVLNQ